MEKQKITIPMSLAKLLAANDEDFVSAEKAESARDVARAMLRLLLKMEV